MPQVDKFSGEVLAGNADRRLVVVDELVGSPKLHFPIGTVVYDRGTKSLYDVSVNGYRPLPGLVHQYMTESELPATPINGTFAFVRDTSALYLADSGAWTEFISASTTGIPVSQKGVAGGVATLDGGAEVVERLAYEGVAGGVATLDGSAEVVERLSYEGVANGVATLNALGDVEEVPSSVPSVNTLIELRALGSGRYNVVRVLEAGRAGVFAWRTGDQSANVSADSGGGVWVAPDGAATGVSGAWQRQVPGNTYIASWYSSLASAIAHVPSGMTLELEPTTYDITASLSRSEPLIIEGAGATLRQAANVRVLNLNGAYEDITSVSALANASFSIGGTANTVTRLTMATVPAGWVVGDIVRVVSDDATEGGVATERRGENATIVGTTATEVYLSRVLEDDYSTNPRVAKLTDVPFEVRNLGFSSSDPATFAEAILQCTACKHLMLSDLSFDDIGGIAINLIGCYESGMERLRFRRLPNASGKLGYGVNDISGTRNYVNDLMVEQCRHAVTTNINSTDAGATTIERFGPTRDLSVTRAKVGYAEASGLDTHAGSRRTRFIDCVVGDVRNGFSASPCAVQLRGLDEFVINLVATSCQQAIRISAESARPHVIGLYSYGSAQPLDIKAASGTVTIDGGYLEATASTACIIDGARVVVRNVRLSHAFSGDFRKAFEINNGGSLICGGLTIDFSGGTGASYRAIDLVSASGSSVRGLFRTVRGSVTPTAIVRASDASAVAVFVARTDDATTASSGTFALFKAVVFDETAGTSASSLADYADFVGSVLPGLVIA
jgi:hypothetical protein